MENPYEAYSAVNDAVNLVKQEALKNPNIQKAAEVLQTTLGTTVAVKDAIPTLVKALPDVVGETLSQVGDVISSGAQAVSDVISSGVQVIKGALSSGIRNVAESIQNGIGNIRDNFNPFLSERTPAANPQALEMIDMTAPTPAQPASTRGNTQNRQLDTDPEEGTGTAEGEVATTEATTETTTALTTEGTVAGGTAVSGLDFTPIGAALEVGLGLAALGTEIASFFEKPPAIPKTTFQLGFS